jgi:hypothetical protein
VGPKRDELNGNLGYCITMNTYTLFLDGQGICIKEFTIDWKYI